jgi:uroporphyrinogen III methyltransferase/synthase
VSLTGKRVVVTRAAEQADELCALLEAAGAVPIRCPTISIAPPDSYDRIDAALAGLDEFAWVVFTSVNGVRSLVDRAELRGLGRLLRSMRVAAVGKSTAELLAARGVPVAFVPAEEGGRGLADTLPDVAGSSVLLVQGDKSDPVLATTLADRDAEVTALAAYRTLSSAPSGAGLEALREGAEALTFTSPSTVEGFVSLGPDWRGLARRAVVVTIGPTTTAAALSRGLGVHAEALERNMGALVNAVASVFGTARRANQEPVR